MQAAAQQKDSTRVGVVTGAVRDSVHDYALQLATVAVYSVNDSSLINYQLSGNLGEFSFKELPVGVLLKLIVSFMGYDPVEKHFKISATEKRLNFGNLILNKREQVLKDIVVKGDIPPVRMNGDTLEFNADAFKLAPNAVAEDLLKKLPGVVIWGDGAITVNGRTVSSVLVNRKPFFGGDTRVATQNLPKDAIEKVQVYQQRNNGGSPMDSTTHINIQLKKNKSMGYFGKLSAGYGTNERYESDANINLFSKRNQLGIIAASNNINKRADDMSTLLRNSTYKGATDGGLGYQTDFNQQGINRSNVAGFAFQHDFIPEPNAYNDSRLNVDYLIGNNNSTTLNNTETLTTISEDSIQLRQQAMNVATDATTQQLNAKYNRHKDIITFYTNAGFQSEDSRNKSGQLSKLFNNAKYPVSSNEINNDEQRNNRNINIETGIVRKDNGYYRGPRDFTIRNTFTYSTRRNNLLRNSSFVSVADPAQDTLYNRQYNNRNNEINEALFIEWGNFSRSIFGSHGFARGLSMNIQNSFQISHNSRDNEAGDIQSGHLVTNPYLSGKSDALIINEQPALNIGKHLSWHLSGRYSRDLSANLIAQAQFYYLQNTSDHSFQQIANRYQYFVPAASIRYSNIQSGIFVESYNLGFKISKDYPSVDQLVPLVDSSDQYYLRLGNAGLKPADRKEITFSWRRNSFANRKSFNYYVNITGGMISNALSDSSVIDKLGRSAYYTVNMDGNRYLNLRGELNSAFKFSGQQIQVFMSSLFNISRMPSYVNNIRNWSDNIRNTSTVSLYYTSENNITLDLKQQHTFYRSAQTGANSTIFRSYIQSTEAGGSFVLKRLTLGTNLIYNYTSASGSRAHHFTVWNLNASYRMLKANNLEFKVVAMDLLHQNMGIISYGNNNTLTTGTMNTLKQYFLFTIAWYPRKFGKGNNAPAPGD